MGCRGLKLAGAYFLMLACVIFAGVETHAQTPLQPNFDHITVNEGLSHSDAMEVVQDLDGFVWIATNKGVDRYDGVKIKNYSLKIDDPQTLSDNRIRSLHVSAGGELWVGTENGGVNFYERSKDRFSRINAARFPPAYKTAMDTLATCLVNAITTVGRKFIYVGTQDHGLFRLERGADNQYISLQRISLPGNKQYNYSVSALAPLSEGRLWVGTLSNGLYEIAGDSLDKPLALRPIPGTDDNIQAIHLDTRKNLWVASPNAVYLFSPSQLPGREYRATGKSSFSFPTIATLHVDSLNRLWVGTHHGLFIVHPYFHAGEFSPTRSLQEGFVEIILPEDGNLHGLSSSRIHKIMEDHTQNLWIATSAGGINKVNLLAKEFQLLHRDVNRGVALPSNYINGICKDEKRNLLWIATRNGFSKYDFARETYTNYLSREVGGDATGLEVTSVFLDSDGNLWCGTWLEGLIRVTFKDGKEQLHRQRVVPGQRGLNSNNVMAFAEDSFGFIWVSTAYGGMHKFNKQGQLIERYESGKNGLPTNDIRSLYYEPSANLLWASSNGEGLLKFEVRRDTLLLIKQYLHEQGNPHSLAVNYTWPVAKDRHNNLWIGTLGGGLHQLVRDANGNETIQRFGDIVPESDVESIQIDSQGNLWIGGAGLLRFNAETKNVWRLDVSDGLQSNSFKVGASCASRNGTFYFGGINGITAFKPERITLNPYAPEVLITGLRIFNKPIGIDEEINGRVLIAQDLHLTKEIVIKANENDFSIDFVALHYSNPKRNAYAYKLEGYHADWIYPAAGQYSATFANLSPGTYTLWVKASNGDGVWSKHPASLEIKVLPPWYRTGWAFAIYATLIVAGISIYWRIRNAQQELKNKLILEKIHHEKDQELNAMKAQFFTNVSHELRTPLTLLMGPLEEAMETPGRLSSLREKMGVMHKHVKKLLDLVNQLMDFQKIQSEGYALHVSKGNLISFLQEIFLIFKFKAEEKYITYTFESVFNELPVCFDRNKLEIVIVNLLSNAFKYSTVQGVITIRVSVVGDVQQKAEYENNTLKTNYCAVVVEDAGSGIDAKDLEKIFDPYYQAAHTDRMQVVGTGIGLALVKKIVEQHKGEITVQSKVGQGTSFTLKLPLGEEYAQEQLSSETEFHEVYNLEGHDERDPLTTQEVKFIAGSKLLIVEDNVDILHYLSALFDPFMHVEVAQDGLEGYTKALATMPDIILSDIMMPHGNGLDLCKKVKQNPKTMHIPVLLLTARAASVHELEGLESGADDYIVKPFNATVLKARLFSVLRNRRRLTEFYNKQILLEPTEIAIPDREREFLEQAMRIVEDHLTDPDFSVPLLIKAIGMSNSAFYRRIKNSTGQSPIEFIRDVRLRRAAQLLKKDELRISEICEKIGIADVQYFRKIFQQRYHMTPAEFAKTP